MKNYLQCILDTNKYCGEKTAKILWDKLNEIKNEKQLIDYIHGCINKVGPPQANGKKISDNGGTSLEKIVLEDTQNLFTKDDKKTAQNTLIVSKKIP
jgi:hypothetical protein